MSTTSPIKPKLNPAIAKAIITAEITYKRAYRALKRAEEKRAEVRAKYADQVPYGTEVEGGGHIIKRWLAGGGKTFAIGKFLEKHKATPEMQEFIGDRPRYDQWSVEPIDGPPAP